MGTVGVNATSDGEACLVELKDADVPELIAVRVEELVVVDGVVLAENPPAVLTEIGLGWASLDLVVKSFLSFVGVRKIELVGEKKRHGEDCGGEDHRRHD